MPATEGKGAGSGGEINRKLIVSGYFQRSRPLHFDSWKISVVYNRLSGMRGWDGAREALRNADLLTIWGKRRLNFRVMVTDAERYRVCRI